MREWIIRKIEQWIDDRIAGLVFGHVLGVGDAAYKSVVSAAADGLALHVGALDALNRSRGERQGQGQGGNAATVRSEGEACVCPQCLAEKIHGRKGRAHA